MRLLRAFLVLSLLLLPQMANAETLMMATTTSTPAFWNISSPSSKRTRASI